MTALQKEIIIELLAGGNISANRGRIVLRDKRLNPIRKIRLNTYRRIQKLLRVETNGFAVINKMQIRKLHGRSWVKQYYRQNSIKPKF